MSTIAAGTTSGTALVSTGDTTGALVLQTNGTTTAVTIATNQVVTLAQPLPVGSGGTGATSLSGITTGTSTNLAGGSNGTIPYQSAAGTTQMLAVGSSGQVLQTNGAGAPTWVTPGGGSWIFLQTLTASSSASLTYSGFTTTYDVYAVVFASVVPATNAVTIRCNPYSVSGGAETNNKTAAYIIENGSASNTTGQSATNTTVGSNVSNTSTSRGLSGVMYFSNPKGASGYMGYWFQTVYATADPPEGQMRVGGGFSGSSLQYDGFVVSANSGNLASGTIRIYGIKNS
jgi:hypothetical protein